MERIIDEFLVDYYKREPYASKELLKEILTEVAIILKKYQDKSKEEIINLLIKKNLEDFEYIRKMYGVPGFNAHINVNNIDVSLYGGNINYLGEPMKDVALFDIASMTKFYTQIVAYNLMREGLFKREDKISDLNPRFSNLIDLSVDDVLTFSVSFRTDGLIKEKKTIDEALNTLYNVQVVEKGKWNYNDLGLMIMKEVMEYLTGKSFPQLVDDYIIKPFNLLNTHIIVPRCKYHLITATPNFKEGKVNDMSAIALGGYSGHAGIFSSSGDLAKLMKNVRNKSYIHDAYTPGKVNDAIGVMGNVYTTNPLGLSKTFVDVVEPRDTFAIAGSTRVNAESSIDANFNILFNPSSMGFEDAKEKVAIINEKRKKQGLMPINPVKEFEFNHDGELKRYRLIDSRILLPVDDMAEVVKNMARTVLKIRFLDFYLKKYFQDNEKVDIEKNVK